MDLSFTPKEAFRTLPFPDPRINPELDALGREYDALRIKYRSRYSEGTTDLYNRFHDPDSDVEYVPELRALLKDIDEAAVRAYGWEGIELAHDYYEVSYLPEDDCRRFTISNTARINALRNLSFLNRTRYEDESDEKHNGGASSTKSPRRARSTADAENKKQSGFDFGTHS